MMNNLFENACKYALEKQNPNFDLSLEDKKEGGLGIYIVKNMMDEVNYEYKDNMNYLTLKKYYRE